MTDSGNPTESSKPKGGYAWVTAAVPLLIIAIAGGAYYLISQGEEPIPGNPPPATLRPGSDVYVLVRTIELYPKRPDAKAWDVDDSGPDIAYQLIWQDNTVFESPTRSDTLIGSWDVLALSIKDAVLKGEVALASSINAAIISVEEGTELNLTVRDQDIARADEAGAFTIKADQLTLGDNTLDFAAADDNAVKRLVIRVIDKTLPLEELVNKAIQP